VGLSIKQRVLHDVKTCVKFAIGALAILSSSNSSSVNVKAASDKCGPVDDDDDDDVSDRQAVLEVALLVVVGARSCCAADLTIWSALSIIRVCFLEEFMD
jgi:hypothetical protein